MSPSIWDSIYQHNLWGGRQSLSGSGSDLEETAAIRAALPLLLTDLGVTSLVDIPCGDYNWWPETPNLEYIGIDIVEAAILENRIKYPNVTFQVGDLTSSQLPHADAYLVRDCLGHFSSENVEKALANIFKTNPKYLIATHWPTATYQDIVDGSWRPINMMHYLDEPPISWIEEDMPDKYLGVWKCN